MESTGEAGGAVAIYPRGPSSNRGAVLGRTAGGAVPYPWEGLSLIGVLPWATRLVELLPYTREALPLKGVLPWASRQAVHEATKARLPCGSVAGVLSLNRTRAGATCLRCALAGVAMCVTLCCVLAPASVQRVVCG